MLQSLFLVSTIASCALVGAATEVFRDTVSSQTDAGNFQLQANDYLVQTFYTDSTCTTIKYIKSFQLGACRPESGGNSVTYTYISATHYQYNVYANADCSGSAQSVSTLPLSTNMQMCQTIQTPYIQEYSSTYATIPGSGFTQEFYPDSSCGTSAAMFELTAYPTNPYCGKNDDNTYYNFELSPQSAKRTEGYSTSSCTATSDSTVSLSDCTSPQAGMKFDVAPVDKVEDAVCFAGSETLLLESGAQIAMEDVHVGDRVQVTSVDGVIDFADVIYIPHKKNFQAASFIEIETTSSSLKATLAHLVMSGVCGSNDMKLTRAEDVAIGACMDSVRGEETVTTTSMTEGRGVYSIVTSHPDDMIVVNGFIVSSFAINHLIGNTYYHTHRALMAYFPEFYAINSFIATIAEKLASFYQTLS